MMNRRGFFGVVAAAPVAAVALIKASPAAAVAPAPAPALWPRKINMRKLIDAQAEINRRRYRMLQIVNDAPKLISKDHGK